jgi:hypothetical protein
MKLLFTILVLFLIGNPGYTADLAKIPRGSTQGYVQQFQKEQGLPTLGISGSLTRTATAGVCNSNSFGGRASTMILATVTVENVDRFLEVFSTKVAAKRALYGSKGATVFRDPTEENRVWGLFDMGEAGWAKFVSDPEIPSLLKEAGALRKPQALQVLGCYPS